MASNLANGLKKPVRLSVLRNRGDFLKLLKDGQRARPVDWLVVNFLTNADGKMRCGWTLPRQVGNAVIRNRLKRWSRIYFRELLKSEKTLPVDINLVFRKTPHDFYKKLDYEEFSQILDKAWEQVRIRFKRVHVSADRGVPNGIKRTSRRGV